MAGESPSIAGAVAMTFNTESRVGVPLQAAYEESSLSQARAFGISLDDPQGRWDEKTPPPEPEESPKAALKPSVEPPAPPADGLASSSSSDLPAHLQLPSIDFSLPNMGDLPSPATSFASPKASAEMGSALPAHLALPEFPTFELPPIPGTQSREQVQIRGTEGGGSFDTQVIGGVGTPGEGVAPAGESWSVAPAATLPPPPPLPPRRAKPALSAPAPQASLPDFGLPALAVEKKKSSVTLVESPASDEDD
ncbi:MAG: hypothetical protein AAB426_14400, partial [Myxococcota bacterium]